MPRSSFRLPSSALAALATLTLTALVPVGPAHAVKGLVANGGAADTVTLFDTATGDAITITYAFFKKPRHVAITDDGRFAGVTNSDGGTITWLDVRNHAVPVVLGKTFVDANPKGIAIRGGVAVVALDTPTPGAADAVKVIDVSKLPGIPRDADVTTLPLAADTNPDGVAITPDGRFAIVTQPGAKKLAYVDLTGLTPVLLAKGTKIGAGGSAVAITPDGARALVTNKAKGTLSIVDLAGLPVVPGPTSVTTFAIGEAPGGLAITPDGATAVIAEAGASDDALVIDLGALTYGTIPLATPSAPSPDPFGVALFAGPTGPLAAISNTTANRVAIVDVVTGAIVDTIDAGAGPQGIAMLPVKAPKAGLTVTPNSGGAPLTVTLDASKSIDPDGVITAYVFTFGDGTTQTSAVPIVTHTYTEVGKYQASLVVTDDDGATSAQVVASIDVQPNRAPKAALKVASSSGKAPFTVTFNASKSSDPDGTIASYAFTFGDGSTQTSATPTVTHTYVAAGKYTASVIVTDNAGVASAAASVSVEAKANKLPSAKMRIQPAAGTGPLTVVFTDQSKDDDGQIVAAHWDFGDGASSDERNPTHLYTTPGKYVVTLTVTDDSGGTAQKTGKVEVRAK